MLLLLEIRFNSPGDLQLPRADVELDAHFLQLALRCLSLRAHIVELLPQAGNLVADAFEIGILWSSCLSEQKHG